MPRRIKQGGTKMPMKDKVKQDMTSDDAYKIINPKTINPKTTGKPKKEPEIRFVVVGEDGKMLDKPEYIKEYSKGGRVNLRGGGMCKKGMNKKARGANS